MTDIFSRVCVLAALALAWGAATAGTTAGGPAPGTGFANAGLDGTWQITRPQAELSPSDGPIPFTSVGRAAYDANRGALARHDRSFDTAQSRCASPGLPRLDLTPMRFRIWVRPRMITFQYEWNRLVRSVDLRGVATKPLAGQAIGVATGRWDHGTLAEQVTDFTDETLIDDLVPHTTSMMLTERWQLLDADTLEARLTIADPAYFSRPWQAVVTYRRQPDAAFTPDVCLDRLHAGQMPLPTE